MQITVFRFEFKEAVDGQNPFDAICKECGLNPAVIDSLTFETTMVGFVDSQTVKEESQSVTFEQAREAVEEIEEKHSIPEVVDKDPRGHIVKKLKHNSIWSKPLKDFKKAVRDGTPRIDVFRKYSPKAKDNSLTVYVSLYSRYLRDTDSQPQKKVRKKYRIQPPKDAYKYCEKYGMWTLKKEIGAVMNAMGHIEHGWIASTNAIAKLTFIPITRVLACLDVLIQEDKITYARVKRARIYSQVKVDDSIYSKDDIQLVKSALKNKGKSSLKEIRKTISLDKSIISGILGILKQRGEVEIFYSNFTDTKYKVVA